MFKEKREKKGMEDRWCTQELVDTRPSVRCIILVSAIGGR